MLRSLTIRRCWIVGRRGTFGQEALAIYQDLGLKSFQLKALEALAAVGKALQRPKQGG